MSQPRSLSLVRVSGLLLVVLLLAATARAEDPQLVAVLPFNSTGSMPVTGLEPLTESVRQATGDSLSPLGYTVLTNDNTLRILADNGIDATKACEGSCSLEVAKEFKARLFITGTVAMAAENDLVAFIRLFDAKNGRQIGSMQLDGASMKELRHAFNAQAPEFFRTSIAKLKDVGIIADVTQLPVVVATPSSGTGTKVSFEGAGGTTGCPEEVTEIKPCRVKLFPGALHLRVGAPFDVTREFQLEAPGARIVLKRGAPALRPWAIGAAAAGGVLVLTSIILAVTGTGETYSRLLSTPGSTSGAGTESYCTGAYYGYWVDGQCFGKKDPNYAAIGIGSVGGVLTALGIIGILSTAKDEGTAEITHLDPP